MDSRKMLYLINATEETGIKEICEINLYNAIKTVSAMQPKCVDKELKTGAVSS